MNLQEGKNTLLEEALVGVNDVATIQLLFKNMIYSFVEDVLEKSQNPWDLKKICE